MIIVIHLKCNRCNRDMYKYESDLDKFSQIRVNVGSIIAEAINEFFWSVCPHCKSGLDMIEILVEKKEN